MTKFRSRYFVTRLGQPEREVDLAGWIDAETAAGFHGHGPRRDHAATGGFGGRGISGRIELTEIEETPVSMSTHVTGFRAPDEHWKQMQVIWDACTAAGIPVPQQVAVFFNWEPPDPAGVEVELPAREWKDGMRQGYELALADIPAGVTVIRFWNSW